MIFAIPQVVLFGHPIDPILSRAKPINLITKSRIVCGTIRCRVASRHLIPTPTANEGLTLHNHRQVAEYVRYVSTYRIISPRVGRATPPKKLTLFAKSHFSTAARHALFHNANLHIVRFGHTAAKLGVDSVWRADLRTCSAGTPKRA